MYLSSVFLKNFYNFLFFANFLPVDRRFPLFSRFLLNRVCGDFAQFRYVFPLFSPYSGFRRWKILKIRKIVKFWGDLFSKTHSEVIYPWTISDLLLFGLTSASDFIPPLTCFCICRDNAFDVLTFLIYGVYKSLFRSFVQQIIEILLTNPEKSSIFIL